MQFISRFAKKGVSQVLVRPPTENCGPATDIIVYKCTYVKFSLIKVILYVFSQVLRCGLQFTFRCETEVRQNPQAIFPCLSPHGNTQRIKGRYDIHESTSN